MVKIIKHGGTDREICRFLCKHCGCIFEMDKLNYSKSVCRSVRVIDKFLLFDDETMYLAICPECGNLVKQKEKMQIS